MPASSLFKEQSWFQDYTVGLFVGQNKQCDIDEEKLPMKHNLVKVITVNKQNRDKTNWKIIR